MLRTLSAAVAVALILALILYTSGRADRLKDGGLPGARPVVEAADYPTLQAALDAIPSEG